MPVFKSAKNEKIDFNLKSKTQNFTKNRIFYQENQFKLFQFTVINLVSIFGKINPFEIIVDYFGWCDWSICCVWS